MTGENEKVDPEGLERFLLLQQEAAKAASEDRDHYFDEDGQPVAEQLDKLTRLVLEAAPYTSEERAHFMGHTLACKRCKEGLQKYLENLS